MYNIKGFQLYLAGGIGKNTSIPSSKNFIWHFISYLFLSVLASVSGTALNDKRNKIYSFLILHSLGMLLMLPHEV